MDYLLNSNVRGFPEGQKQDTYFVIDNSLQYISMSDESLYYLYYVDCDIVGEVISSSENSYGFDYFIISKCKPIKLVNCHLENDVRILDIQTHSGNWTVKKNRQSRASDIIRRDISNTRKLF